ncbi:MAG: hypothetical protein HYR84_15640 [Planctomycetes bacterium]|nr:hypothetical protein [Planctomycetota bacterium]
MEPQDDYEAQKRRIAAGTILFEGGEVFRVLEDTTAHGCPLVEMIDPGETNYQRGDRCYRTLYQHLTIGSLRVTNDEARYVDDLVKAHGASLSRVLPPGVQYALLAFGKPNYMCYVGNGDRTKMMQIVCDSEALLEFAQRQKADRRVEPQPRTQDPPAGP